MGHGMPPPQFGMPPHGFNPNMQGHMQGRPPPHQMGMPPPHYGNPNMPPHPHMRPPPPHMMHPPHQGGPHGGPGGMPPQHHPGMGGPPPQHHPGGPPPQHHPGMPPQHHQPGMMGMPPQQQPGMMPPQIQQHPISNDAKVDVVARADHLIAQSTIMKKSSKKKIIRIYDRPGISMEEMRASNPRYAPQAH